nr:MAG TPA: hypothetical protein [Caudoviricetes sp.]
MYIRDVSADSRNVFEYTDDTKPLNTGLLSSLYGLFLSRWGSACVPAQMKAVHARVLPCSLNRPLDVFWRTFVFQKARYG